MAGRRGQIRTKEFRFPEVALKVPEVAWLMSTRRRNERIWHQASVLRSITLLNVPFTDAINSGEKL